MYSFIVGLSPSYKLPIVICAMVAMISFSFLCYLYFKKSIYLSKNYQGIISLMLVSILYIHSENMNTWNFISLCGFALLSAANFMNVIHFYQKNFSSITLVNDRFSVQIKAKVFNANLLANAKITDISPSGCFIETQSKLKLNEQIQLQLELSENQEPRCLTAKIIRISKEQDGYGLQFTGFDRRNHSCCEDFVKNILVEIGSAGPNYENLAANS